MASVDAQKAKDMGNAAFKAAQYPEAIGHYTTAVLANPTDPTYPLNRAAAYLKLGKYEDAERDCTTVLRLKHGHVKGLYRRAQARIELAKFDEAEQDLREALQSEPNNEPVKTELKKLEALRVQSKKTGHKSSQELNRRRVPIEVVEPSSSQAGSTSPPKRRRVPIEIVESSTARPSTIDVGHDLNPVSTRTLSPTPNVPLPKSSGSTSSVASPRVAASKAPEVPSDRPKPKVGGGIFRRTGNHTVVQSPKEDNNAKLSKSADDTTVKQSTSAHLESASLVSVSVAPKSPMTLFSFRRAWEAHDDPTDRWNLIQKIQPTYLPTLFQTSLEPTLLVSIVETFQSLVSAEDASDEDKEMVNDYMKWFAKIPRFETVVLFLSSREKSLVRSVCMATGGKVSWGI
ncbi:hypothetical protein BD410DRAFT_787515 [Rickenella mellea]|uniref:RNA polymerase II-associated protein 3 n=1 Tax=Rickenella mellea TaxID=50990 RepID=A0A4Y7Q7L5_9AGAM|nr:hypothetical protein BD410DRAFT_787515 [Rickenella mellea]